VQLREQDNHYAIQVIAHAGRAPLRRTRMRQWLRPMNDDPIEQAQTALQRAQTALQDIGSETAAPLVEMLRAYEAVLDRLRDMQQRALDMERNLAAQQALLDDRLLRVEHNTAFTLWNTVAAIGRNTLRSIQRVAGSSAVRLAHEKALRADYATWVAREQASLSGIEQARAISAAWTRQPRLSLILAIREGRGFAETLHSIEDQVYRNWELCLVVEKACQAGVLPLVCDFEASHTNVRHAAVDGLDVASALNAAAALARGEYFVFLDQPATLAPFALYSLAEALQSGAFDVLYPDEDLLDSAGRRVHPIFKPDWSPDLLTSCMYMGSLVAVRRETFQQYGGLRSGYDGAELHDLVLRLTDAPAAVHHIPKVLLHSPTAQRPKAEGGGPCSTNPASARAIEDAITRREGTAAECVPGPGRSGFLVRRKRPSGSTTAVICSKSPELLRKCLSSLRATADRAVAQTIVIAHEDSGAIAALRSVIQQAGATAVSFGGAFNFAAMNNLGAELAQTPNLLFLNDDVEATSPEWVEMLNEQVSREDVGVAGGVLWYPSRVLQHAGIVAGISDGVGHVGRYAQSSELWPWLLTTRNVSAVTGACLAIRSELFRELGGFDIGFPNNYNDVDLCFRVRARGLAIVCVPVPGLIHRECQTRRGIVRFAERYRFYQRWADALSHPDGYYSPSLAPTEEIALNLKPDSWGGLAHSA
jgi:GT2 family glycosyltransferase